MAKIYETPQDVARDDLTKKSEISKIQAQHSFSLAPLYLMIGSFAHLAKPTTAPAANSSQSKFWNIYENHGERIAKGLKWFGYVFGAAALINGYIYKRDQIKAEKELTILGQEEVISTLPGHSSVIETAISSNTHHQAAQVLQTSTIHSEPLQKREFNNVNQSLRDL